VATGDIWIWNNDQTSLLIITAGGAFMGLFMYNGSPRAGNPPVLAAVSPGVTSDPYGNALTVAGVLINNMITVGPSGGSQIELAPAANIPFGTGTLQSAAQFSSGLGDQGLSGRGNRLGSPPFVMG
jgi:hypothetical protein